MTTSDQTAPGRASLLNSFGAVFAGLVTIFVVSMIVDQVLHATHVYPPERQPMRDPGLNLLALSYRLVIDTFGCWLAARLAPSHSMRHALILGGIGTVLSILGAIAGIMMDLGPAWYPIALVVSAMPCAWLGGRLARR